MRVLTSSIKKNLPNDLIVLIWKFYDEAYFGIQFDDFQFFKIENSEERTTIKMWQEEPPAIKTKSIPHFEDCEVWIINDGNVVTMLFPKDY